MDDTCDSVCDECETALTTKKMPPFALANGFWIGNVPLQLKNLSFAEGMLLIARIRHNRCLIRVSSGRAKMIANIIMFSNPILKELPSKKDELEEILAFIFTGSTQPTPEDFERTPMFFRHNKVAEALEWLKLNHRDYEDIVISRENLDSYALARVPVAVNFRRTNKEDGNKLGTQMSVHDSEDDEGTTNGSCPFTVHGLTGPEYEQMDMQALKAKAAVHLLNEGKTLGVGQAANPESMYDNPQAYPQMFPWLFPYGFGGFGKTRIRGRIGEGTHTQNLLLYHDKRF